MKNKYQFKDLINGVENLPKELLNYDSVLYRINDIRTNKNYIGTAKYGLPGRLYDRVYGHVTRFKSGDLIKCRGMYHEMNYRLDDFYIYIEHVTSPENYESILIKETELIKEFDSVLFGYNVSIDGKPGWKEGTICINDGTFDLYIYPEDINKYLSNGFVLGSCKHDFLKGSIWINNGIESRMINPKDFLLFEDMGYSKGNLMSPNKGKIWVNNGITSKIVNRDDLTLPELKEFKFFGRIESTPRKPRGKYNPSKKRKILNNGEKEIRVLENEVNEFLKNNPDYSLGKIKGKVLVSNPILKFSKYIKKSEIEDYISKGFILGKLK